MELTLFLLVAFYTVAAYAKDLLFVDELLSYYSYEPTEADALGLDYTVVTTDEWMTMSTKDFASFKAIIISDPGPGYDPYDIQFLEDSADVWGPAVQGNIIIHGTDASNHYADSLISNSIKFAVAGKSTKGSQQTGLFLSLTQYYDYDDFATVGALSYFGNFTVRGNLDCYNDAHIVASSPAIDNLTDIYLSNWDCSVHEAFSSYPTTGKDGFQALAIADGVTGIGTQNFAGGHYGLPYIISRGATPAGCGDGHWDEALGEDCDDGNTKDGDGCSRSCKCESGRVKGNGTCYPVTDSSGLVMMPDPFIDVTYFTAVYMTIIVTVLFRSLWEIVLASTKMIEPFYQLHKENGASAKESLLSDYLSSGLSKESLMNVFRKHWVMTLTTGVYVMATISMAVASESMTIRSGNSCTTPEDPLQCDLQWVIDVKIARALQAFMSLCACMILLRIILGRRRASGVNSYPCTIAAMAALLRNAAIMNSFLHIEPDAKKKDVVKALSENYYGIRQFEASPGNFSYGLVQIAAPANRSRWNLSSIWSAIRGPVKPTAAAPNVQEQPKKSKDRSELWSNVCHGLFLAIHLAFFGVFLYYRLTQNDSLFVNKTKGTRIILSFVAIGISIGWSQVEAEVRIMTPYRRLAKAKTDSRHIIDMSLHGVPLTTFLHAIWYGNFYHALIALTAIISQLLIIAVTGIPYNFGVIQQVSLFSSTACLGILGLQMMVGLTIFWWRKTNPKMPRRPDTIASIVMMLCASKMLQHFDGLGHGPASEEDLVERIEGRQYRLGKEVCANGKERVTIEVVEVQEEKIPSEKQI